MARNAKSYPHRHKLTNRLTGIILITLVISALLLCLPIPKPTASDEPLGLTTRVTLISWKQWEPLAANNRHDAGDLATLLHLERWGGVNAMLTMGRAFRISEGTTARTVTELRHPGYFGANYRIQILDGEMAGREVDIPPCFLTATE